MASVKVSNISSSTTEKEIRDFFSFCGKISSLKLDGSNATITFEKESAAKTAILLHDTTLSGSNVHVEPLDGATSGQTSAAHHDDDEELRQEDKPKSRIMVEYLTAGYKLGDGVITKAIEIDNKNGISGRFQNALKQFDAKTGASEKAAQLDKKYDITNKAQDTAKQGWQGLSSYYEKFTGTPTGQRVHQFYLSGAKTVQDVHNEAMRQSGLRDKYAQGSSEKHQPHEIDNSGHTTCSCSANEGTCGCKPGQCRCSSCPKNDQSQSTSGATSGSGLTATGDADKIAAASNVAPLGEKKA